MKTNIKLIISFVTGVLTGGAGVYVFTKKRYDTLMNQETEELKAYYERYYKVVIDDLEGQVQKLRKDGPVEVPKEEEPKAKKATAKKKEDPIEVAKEEYNNIVKTDYAAISAPKKPVTKKKKASTEDKPYIISYEEYEADRKHDKVMLTYLAQEDMLVSEDELEPVEDGMDWVGHENLELDFKNDEDTVYVRNDSRGEDYEIVIDVTHKSFEDFLKDSM